MNNLRFCQIVIILLVVLNLGTMAFLLFGHPCKERVAQQGRSAEFLIRELGLSNTQQDEFGQLRDLHQDQLQVLQELDRKLHNRFFEMIFLPAADTLSLKILADSIAQVRIKTEMLTYEHFSELKKLLTLQQKEKFHRIFKLALEQVMPPPLPPLPPVPPPPPPPPPPVPSSRGG